MNAPRITSHAVSRYRLRVAPVSEAEQYRDGVLRYGVLLYGSLRERRDFVTVLPAANYRKQVHRRGLGRYGKTNGGSDGWADT